MTKLEDLNIKKMEQSAAQASALMRALGHEKRLLILCHLTGGEVSVGALARRVDLAQSPLSQHAQTIYYRLSSSVAKKVIKILYKTYCG
jgi:ArsR family transcriptional regulator, virulence genes transcriptional regulator